MFFVVSLAFVATCCGNNDEKLTLECAKKYLGDRGMKEDLLSYVDAYVGSLSDCESAVRSKLAVLYSNLRSRLSGNRVNRPFVECAMRDIEEEDDESYEQLILRETAVEMVSNWRFWSYWSKSSRLDELRTAAESLLDKSLLKCKGHREFGDLFSNIQDFTVSWDRSGEEEYCIRSYLVTKQLINPSFYGFNGNPKKVPTERLECDPLVASVVEKIYKEIEESKKISTCYLNVYRENNYAYYILKAELLSKLNLSISNRSREKQDFIKAMVDITYDTRKC